MIGHNYTVHGSWTTNFRKNPDTAYIPLANQVQTLKIIHVDDEDWLLEMIAEAIKANAKFRNVNLQTLLAYFVEFKLRSVKKGKNTFRH